MNVTDGDWEYLQNILCDISILLRESVALKNCEVFVAVKNYAFQAVSSNHLVYNAI